MSFRQVIIVSIIVVLWSLASAATYYICGMNADDPLAMRILGCVFFPVISLVICLVPIALIAIFTVAIDDALSMKGKK
jgi:hypothetical protein